MSTLGLRAEVDIAPRGVVVIAQRKLAEHCGVVIIPVLRLHNLVERACSNVCVFAVLNGRLTRAGGKQHCGNNSRRSR